jgi:hypothetical protein
MRNKKGNVYFGIGMGLFIFIMGVLFLPFILDDIDTSRAAMSCSSSDSITDGAKLFCLAISGLTPYFIWFFVSTALGYIVGSKT